MVSQMDIIDNFYFPDSLFGLKSLKKNLYFNRKPRSDLAEGPPQIKIEYCNGTK